MARTSPQYIENILLKLSDAAAQVQRVHSPDDVFRTIARHLADLGLRAAVLHLQDPRIRPTECGLFIFSR